MARPVFLRIDWILLGATLAVVAVGLPYLHSASPLHFRKQIVWVALGFAVLVGASLVDYRHFLRYAYRFYALALVLLVAVLLLPDVRGARSWIAVPGLGFNIQPAELMKPALVLALARYLMRRESQATWAGLVAPFLLTLVPMALILKQPDLGTALLLPPLLFAVLFASGARVAHLGATALAGAASLAPLWLYVMKAYQRNRILAFLNPEKYEAREAYQLILSLIAIGSGGLFGQGLRGGRMNELDLLPDKHTDFVFGVIAEEGGFVVAVLLLLLYAVMVLEGLHVAHRTREPGGRLVAVGCACLLGVQVCVNVGVVTALLPTTGITLPFVSYGGSSMLVSFLLVGLILNVGARRPLVVDRESFSGRGRG